MREPPKCRKCGRVITFVTTKKGSQMPVDGFSVSVLPYMRGSVYYTDRGEQLRGYLVPPGTKGAVSAFTPHWYTCPYADELRRKKPDRRREAIKAQVEREREQTARREARREEKAAKAAEALEAQGAQFSLFGAMR